MKNDDSLVIFSFAGDVEHNLQAEVSELGGVFSTRHRLVGGEQIAEIAFYVTIPAALKYISETIREIVRSRRVNVTLGDNKFENISEEKLDELVNAWKKKSEEEKP